MLGIGAEIVPGVATGDAIAPGALIETSVTLVSGIAWVGGPDDWTNDDFDLLDDLLF